MISFAPTDLLDALLIDLEARQQADEMKTAIRAIERILEGPMAAPIPSADVVRLFVAFASEATKPAASSPEVVFWFAHHRLLCVEWGLTICDGQPWEVAPRATASQLHLFPQLSRIFLRSMVSAARAVIAPAAAWELRP